MCPDLSKCLQFGPIRKNVIWYRVKQICRRLKKKICILGKETSREKGDKCYFLSTDLQSYLTWYLTFSNFTEIGQGSVLEALCHFEHILIDPVSIHTVINPGLFYWLFLVLMNYSLSILIGNLSIFLRKLFLSPICLHFYFL